MVAYLCYIKDKQKKIFLLLPRSSVSGMKQPLSAGSAWGRRPPNHFKRVSMWNSERETTDGDVWDLIQGGFLILATCRKDRPARVGRVVRAGGVACGEGEDV